MKLLINAINDNEYPRGPDRYLDELLRHMLAHDAHLDVRLCIAPWQVHFVERDYGASVTKHVLTPPRAPTARAVWQASGFPRFANKQDVDLVFLPNLLWTPGLRSPSVMVAHDLLQFRAPDKFGARKAAALRYLIRMGLARVDHVISVSEFTARDITTFTTVPAERISVIHEGGPDAQRSSHERGMDFLFVGKIEKTKNVDLLITAFQRSDILEKLGARLVICGPDGNASDDISSALGHPRIDRVGFVSETELERLYQTCRAFVFPSSAEGFGLVLLEAMARGAPVIAADATSLPEVMGAAGILVPDLDEDALRIAMEKLALSDDLCDQLRASGFARLTAFSWDRAARETLELFYSVSGPKKVAA